jgi:hypothetical protein
MRTQNRRFRLIATVSVAGLLIAQMVPQPATAQGAPPPLPQVGVPDQQNGDPPERVGRLAQLSGAVSFHSQDDSQWNPATLNYPVTQGNAFWTEPNARAVIEVSASRIAMAPGTELDVATLTSTAFQATQPQGEVYLHLRPAAPDETYAVQTPRGMVTFAVPGRYGVVAGDIQTPTVVTAIEGSAHVEGPGVSLDVGPGQAASISGSDTFQGQVGPAQRDAFLTAMLDSERPPQSQGIAPPQVVAEMPGGDDLALYGSWDQTQEYGQVWYPPVAPDWVPYRDGSWAYVAPWGWTWVDSAPWGFAPFHYGRWADIGGRWGWIPGGGYGGYRPVYAPALVTFLGVGAVAGVGVGAALAAGRIGWLPLGPREPFHPWYRASDRYVRQVNASHVTNFATVNRDPAFNSFANRRAATVVPTSVMIASRPVAPAFQRVDPAQLAQARPVIGQQPLRPSPVTMGVTPAVARQLNLPPPSPGMHAIAPGPALHATPAGIATGPAMGAVGRQGLPQLHNPAQPTLPVTAGAVRPFAAPPALRTPPAPGQIAPPAIQREPGFAGPGGASPPPPLVNRGGGPTPATITNPSPQFHTAPGATFQQAMPPGAAHAPPVLPPSMNHAPPAGAVQSPPPAVVNNVPAAVHVPPNPAQQFHAPPPQAAFHPPPPVVNNVPAPVQVAPNPPPQFHPATPPAAFHPPPPVVNNVPAAVHVAPNPPPQFHPAAPPAAFHPPPPVVNNAPAAVHVAPSPPPQVHAPPPPPVAHTPPPAQNSQHKRPGEQ